jgi:hypothetical protein
VSDDNGCLSASLAALGVIQIPSIDLKHSGQREYHRALRLTNDAIRSPKLVKQDATLLSVIILSIFENYAGVDHTLDAWRAHLSGAAALLVSI